MKQTLALIVTLIGIYVKSIGQTTTRKIKPSDTDPFITTFNIDSHYVYLNQSVESKNALIVHLPGSFGEPKRATLFGSHAANIGFHSIGLMYPNVPTVGSFCTNSSDPTCFENVRREIVDGINYSSDINIPYNEGIINRTTKLLMFLNDNFPNENWGQFLDKNNNLNYNKIIFSGHSQGGGHAALIAKYYPIKRAVCFSSPKDWRNLTDAPPLWLSTGLWQTNSSQIYCFNHVLDEHTNHQLEIWDSLGLNNYGAPINVDSFTTPYANSRQLTTSYDVPPGDDHACTIQDNKTPKINNVPVFIPVWTYLLSENLITNAPSPIFNNNNELTFSPNPAHDQTAFILPEGDYQLKIIDNSGKIIVQTACKTGKNLLDLSTFKTGIYHVEVKNKRKTFKGKLIKKD